MGYTPITTLTSPTWEQQHGETPKLFERFKLYRGQIHPSDQHNDPFNTDDDGNRLKTRQLQKVADRLQISFRTLQQQAIAHRWDVRCRDYDDAVEAERRRAHEQAIAQEAEKWARSAMSASQAGLLWVRQALTRQVQEGVELSPGEMAKLADASVKLVQAAQRAPEGARAVYRSSESRTDGSGETTSQGWEVELPGLAGLAPDQQRQRLDELVSSMERLARYEDREQQGRGV